MAAYALLNTFAGFKFDMTQGLIGFAPIRPENGHFRCFWSLEGGWGEFEMAPDRTELRVLYGRLAVQRLAMPLLPDANLVTLAGQPVRFQHAGTIVFDRPLVVDAAHALLR